MTASSFEVEWNTLTPNEQRVLTSAMENQQLSSLYRKWRPPEDMTSFRGADDGGRPYAEALIPAAVELLHRGLIEVVTRDPDFRILSPQEALAAAEEIDNWWRYVLRPGVKQDVDELIGSRHRMVDVGWQSSFALGQGSDFVLSEWHWPPRMPLIASPTS